MPKYRMNLADIPEGPVTVESGTYPCVLVDCNEEESQKGHPMLVWDWEILSGEFQGRALKSRTSLLEHALFGYRDHVVALGVPADYTEDVDTDRLVGKKALLIVVKNKIKSKTTGDEIFVSNVERVEALTAEATKATGTGKTKVTKKDDAYELPF